MKNGEYYYIKEIFKVITNKPLLEIEFDVPCEIKSSNEVTLHVLSIDGRLMSGLSSFESTCNVEHLSNGMSRIRLILQTNRLLSVNITDIVNSFGRLVLRAHFGNDSVFLPIRINEFYKENKKLDRIQLDAGRIVQSYETDLNSYFEKLKTIKSARQNNISQKIDEIDRGVIIYADFTQELNVLLSNNDIEIELINKRYLDCLIFCEWGGGEVGRENGFVFKVYSDDHEPDHFHVIHKGRGINARFTYPSIEFDSYVNKRKGLKCRDLLQIKDFFRINANFEKLKNEFDRVKKDRK